MRVRAIITALLLASTASALGDPAMSETHPTLADGLARYGRGGPEEAARAALVLSAVEGSDLPALRAAEALAKQAGGGVAVPAFSLASRALGIASPTTPEAALALADAWVPEAGSARVWPRIVTEQARLDALRDVSDDVHRLHMLLDRGPVALPPISRSADLAAALGAFAPIDDTVRAQADAIPSSVAEALARILDAHRWQASTAPALLALPADAREAAVLAMDLRLVDEVTLAAPFLTCGWGDIDLPGLVYLELDCIDTVYPTDVYVVVDAGGDDLYLNNAGGGALAGMLVDLEGDDRYQAMTTGGYFTGAGSFGSGFHLDYEGDDWYEADIPSIGGTTGGGLDGSGFHADFSGNDVRITRALTDPFVVAHGGAYTGIGVLYDGSGNDVYEASGAAYTTGGSSAGTSIFFDGSGDDIYESIGGVTAIGSTLGGTSVFVDLGGADDYTAHNVTYAIGSAALGTATFLEGSGDDSSLSTGETVTAIGSTRQGGTTFFLDQRGNDTRVVRAENVSGIGSASGGNTIFVDANGGADKYVTEMWAGYTVGSGIGVAHFIEYGGADEYVTRQTGFVRFDDPLSTNGALGCHAVGAAGLSAVVFIELGGTDRYHSTFLRNATAHGATSADGVAFFLEYSGNDSYEVEGSEVVVANGAALGGSTYFFDLLGNDRYATQASEPTLSVLAHGAAAVGTALLFDASGDDSYDLDADGVSYANGAARLGAGILVDVLGNDSYDGGEGGGASNGAASAGVGLLVDLFGANVFEAAAHSEAVSNGASRGNSYDLGLLSVPYVSAVGILVGGSGDDVYRGGGITQGASDAGLGLLIDTGGDNVFDAAADSLAQGAGRAGGTGILIDDGLVSTFSIGPRAVGQGAGLQALGLLLRPRTFGGGTYFASTDARPLLILGAGLGVRIDEGPATILGVVPDLACVDEDDEIERRDVHDAQGDLLVTIRSCAPNDASVQTVRAAGGPVAPIPKPSCAALPACPLLRDSGPFDADQKEWLDGTEITMTASGGLKILYADTSVEATAVFQITHEVQSADDMCEMSCAAIEAL